MSERSVFIAALEIDDPTGRAAFLESACGGDRELRQRVERLLQLHEQTGGFLKAPAPDLVDTVDERPCAERPDADMLH